MGGSVNTLLESAKGGGDGATNVLRWYQEVIPQVAESITDGNGNSADATNDSS